MKGVPLYTHQLEALGLIRNGCILCGGTGSGKSRTALAYFYKEQHGECITRFTRMIDPQDLYIITTARKRDEYDWESECIPFRIGTDIYSNKVIVDSWNNIKKYQNITGAFFIFDEQKVTGSGVWVKSFLKITKSNKWILLSATPGDTWSDYIPVFIANKFYRNRSEFLSRHAVYSRFTKYPKIDKYTDVHILEDYRSRILIPMTFDRLTKQVHEDVSCRYDISKYKDVTKRRWDIFKDEPIQNAAALCYIWRKIVNMDDSRKNAVLNILKKHPKTIIFYNYDYELDILKSIKYQEGTVVAEWNGHIHDPIPDSDMWVYLVQYTAGAEGWNCIKTDTTIFYSQNYSYKIMLQSCGRIDRLNTPYEYLYYFHLKSHAPIDIAITRAIRNKKQFNESAFVGEWRM